MTMNTRGKAALVQMPTLGGLLTDQTNNNEPIGSKGQTDKQRTKRKSRSKIAKESKKRNRKG